MFEPPIGVLTALCPFCGKAVEVPQFRPGDKPVGYRKRIRKGPGWWLMLRAHLPSWANRAMAASFVMIMTSALIQSWLAAHRLRSADDLERALQAWNQAIESRRDAATVEAADRLLAILQTIDPKEIAEVDSIDAAKIRELRSKAAQADWTRRLQAALALRKASGLNDLKALVAEAAADADLARFTAHARDAWAALRQELMRADLARFEAALAANRGEEAENALKSAENVMIEQVEDRSATPPADAEITLAVDRLAARLGLAIRFRLTEANFANESFAREKALPLFEDRLRALGYVIGKFRHAELERRFRDGARYRLDIDVAERFGRPYEDTPHRTTTIQFDLVLSAAGIAPQRRNAAVRTPRIPAKTAIGMSRLQLSKRSDEKIERKLEEAAWESITGPVTQAAVSLPRPL